MRTLIVLGRPQQTAARPSLIVTGPAAAGKAAALLTVGRACHLAHTRSHPLPPGSAHVLVSVAYVLVPPGASAKALATEFARSPRHPRRVQDGAGPDHRRRPPPLQPGGSAPRPDRRDPPPQPRTTTGAEAADLLKDLTERIRAAFVYAGIGVTGTALFSGARGAQLAARAGLVECGAFPTRLGTHEPTTRDKTRRSQRS
ncbi:hypothetical protein [Streptomyces olivaceoviridis]|uniref:hypothetical protein n=1 Tax=Streptomyces olivaceoviridis TaxID=1921 RepID=UPI0037026FFC